MDSPARELRMRGSPTRREEGVEGAAAACAPDQANQLGLAFQAQLADLNVPTLYIYI